MNRNAKNNQRVLSKNPAKDNQRVPVISPEITHRILMFPQLPTLSDDCVNSI